MGQHRRIIPKSERDGAWKRGVRPRDTVKVAEAMSTYGQKTRVADAQRQLLAPLPEPEEL